MTLFARIRELLGFRPKRELGVLPVPLSRVVPDVLLDTAGLVVAETHDAPLGAPTCAFHRVTVLAGADHTVLTTQSTDRLVIDDGLGTRVLVSLEHAEWRVSDHTRDVWMPDDALVHFLRERGVEPRPDQRAHVVWIPPRQLVFVRGYAREPDGGVASYRTPDSPRVLEMTAIVVSLDPIA